MLTLKRLQKLTEIRKTDRLVCTELIFVKRVCFLKNNIFTELNHMHKTIYFLSIILFYSFINGNDENLNPF